MNHLPILCQADLCRPATVRRDVSDADIVEVAAFADKYMPYTNEGIWQSAVCL